MTRLRVLAACGLLLLSAGALRAQTDSAGVHMSEAAAAQQPGLRPGDVIKIDIWREKDLSGSFLVDENGSATFPLLGDVKVTEMTIPQLRASLLEAYRAQLRNPSITITPMRRVNVLGEVLKPGLYVIDPTVSLAEAVGLAGGATQNGTLTGVRIFRNGSVLVNRPSISQTISEADVRSGDQIVVPQKSWFSRNSAFVISSLISVTSIVIALVRR
jgi:protein involved in polysaccharide export with SLBB domain